MASATKAGFGDTPLSFNPCCSTSLQGTLGRMLSEAGSGPSSSVKEEDDPPGIWKMEGGEICKTRVTNTCQDSEQGR